MLLGGLEIFFFNCYAHSYMFVLCCSLVKYVHFRSADVRETRDCLLIPMVVNGLHEPSTDFQEQMSCSTDALCMVRRTTYRYIACAWPRQAKKNEKQCICTRAYRNGSAATAAMSKSAVETTVVLCLVL